MPTRLLNLRHVPEDEADDVRGFLDAHGIAWYEIPPGLFGISAGGIWVRDDADTTRARQLMHDYQRERQRRAREEWERARRDGTAETFAGTFRAQPLRVLLVLLGVAILLAVMAWPFFVLR
jgi:hypothetical protein